MEFQCDDGNILMVLSISQIGSVNQLEMLKLASEKLYTKRDDGLGSKSITRPELHV